MFQGDQTKNHFYHCMKDLFRCPFIHLFFFLSFFDSPFFLVPFSTILFCSYSFLFSSGVSSTSLELHFFTFTFQHQAFDRLSSREDFSLPLPPMWRVVLDRDIEGNLSGSKGVTMDNFFYISERMMKDGHFSSQT